MNPWSVVVLVIVSWLFSSCSTLLNPYEEEFSCPLESNGRCTDIEGAYQESLQTEDSTAKNYVKTTAKVAVTSLIPRPSSLGSLPSKTPRLETKPLFLPQVQEKTLMQLYEEKQAQQHSKLIKEASTPLVLPARSIRVLLLGYTAGKNKELLFMDRYAYILLQEPQWSPLHFQAGSVHGN